MYFTSTRLYYSIASFRTFFFIQQTINICMRYKSVIMNICCAHLYIPLNKEKFWHTQLSRVICFSSSPRIICFLLSFFLTWKCQLTSRSTLDFFSSWKCMLAFKERFTYWHFSCMIIKYVCVCMYTDSCLYYSHHALHILLCDMCMYMHKYVWI